MQHLPLQYRGLLQNGAAFLRKGKEMLLQVIIPIITPLLLFKPVTTTSHKAIAAPTTPIDSPIETVWDTTAVYRFIYCEDVEGKFYRFRNTEQCGDITLELDFNKKTIDYNTVSCGNPFGGAVSFDSVTLHGKIGLSLHFPQGSQYKEVTLIKENKAYCIGESDMWSQAILWHDYEKGKLFDTHCSECEEMDHP